MKRGGRRRGIVLASLVVALGCGEGRAPSPARKDPAPVVSAPADAATPPAAEIAPAPPVAPAPRGLPPVPSPAHNPTTPERVALGRLLFFDPRLSASGASCATCHRPELGWADGATRSPTAAGRENLRHTPALWNVGYAREWYWDGSMPTLEALVLSNWKGQLAVVPEERAATLGEIPAYRAHFARAFGDDSTSGGPTATRAAEALAAFLRTLNNGDAPWDRHEAGERTAVSAAAIAGARIFNARAGCASCHVPPLYRDGGFHARLPANDLDPGRMRATADPADRGAFRTPGLRGAAFTAPYFHDGRAATLEAAIDAELARDGVHLDALERAQLVAFVRALSPPLVPVAPPELP
jgi:cytochrome c peroxidase